MTCLIFDPFMGASGDMIIASLIDLGADPAHIRETVESVAPITVDTSRTTKNGISATRVRVSEIADKSETSTYPEIVADIRVFFLFSGNVGLSYATTTAIMEHHRSEKSFTQLICVHLR